MSLANMAGLGSDMRVILTLSTVIVMAHLAAAKHDSQNAVLTWSVTVSGVTQTFRFNTTMFNRFYGHLCDTRTARISVYREGDQATRYRYKRFHYNIDTTVLNKLFSSTYKCQMNYGYIDSDYTLHFDYYVNCVKLTFLVLDSYCTETQDNCWTFSVTDQMNSNKCESLNPVEIIWDSQQDIKITEDNKLITMTECMAGCSNTSSWTLDNTVYYPSAATTLKESSTASVTLDPMLISVSPTIETTTMAENTSIIQSSTPSNVSSTYQPSDLVGNQDEGDTTAIIIGVVVTFIVLAAILVVLGIVLWKRRRNATAVKCAIENNNTHIVSNSAYSVAFQNVSDTTTSDQSLPNNLAKASSYDYATIDPVKKVQSNDAAIASNTEDREYYNQDAVDGNPQSSSINTSSLTAGQRGPDYYNLDNAQNGTIAAITSDVSPPLTAISDSQDSGNVYTVTDDTAHTVDGTYSVIDDHTTKTKGSINPHHSNNYNTPANAEYAQANPAISALSSEYSKLHDPIRHIKDPYNVLLSSESEGNQAASTTPTPSAYPDSAPFTYSMAQPYLREPTNHAQPVDVIDVGPPSQQPMKNGRKQFHLKEDLDDNNISEGSENAAPNGLRNEYFELENTNDPDENETI